MSLQAAVWEGGYVAAADVSEAKGKIACSFVAAGANCNGARKRVARGRSVRGGLMNHGGWSSESKMTTIYDLVFAFGARRWGKLFTSPFPSYTSPFPSYVPVSLGVKNYLRPRFTIQAAWGASRTRRSYYSAQHARLTTRRGVKRATIAVAHSLLTTVHCVLSDSKPYADLGANYFDRRRPTPEQQANQMINKLKRFGYRVQVEQRPAA